MPKPFTFFSLAGAAVLLLVIAVLIAAKSPATAPSKTYTMVAEAIDGVKPRQWVLIIITPERYAWAATPEALHKCIERRIAEGSTLEWKPQDVLTGGEPLRNEQDVDALRKFCEAHKIKFVHIPAG
jgi:hypothetical protein